MSRKITGGDQSYVHRERQVLGGAPRTEFVIAKHGEQLKWRHRRDVVLFHGRYVYWREQGVINRTFRLSYMKGGRPDEKVLAKIRKRFWPNTADRQYYWWIARNFD